MTDKGPWNNPEITDTLQEYREKGIECNKELPSRTTLVEYVVSQDTDHLPALQKQCNVDCKAQQILALETELEEIELILQSLVSKHNKLVNSVKQLKELISS
uniref:Uncharacterized protein BB_0439 n=1 Tax=Anthurium amnicola TaxID=1678845 RepID=A0A1D1YRZ0_9ARAE